MMTLAGWMTLDGLYYKKQLGTLHKKSKCALENVETVENNITVITPVVTVFLFFFHFAPTHPLGDNWHDVSTLTCDPPLVCLCFYNK